jgi:glycogen phosphorylase
LALPYDTPITGWRGRHVNALRLWSARAPSPLDLSALNRGDVVGATAAGGRAEVISRVLYPDDSTLEGRRLRLRQEFFFTSASLQDLVRRHCDECGSLATLPDHAAVQLNGTHPAIAVAELMRILVDEHDIAWNEAWAITRGTLTYTNHTLLPEALETWPAELLGQLLPCHLQIIYMINWFHLKETEKRGLTDPQFVSNISLVHEDGTKCVRMAHLAFLGSHTVDGVSALHTDLLRKTVFHDLAKTARTRIVNKTNGITFRRWLFDANEGLTTLLTKTLGERVLDDPRCLAELESVADDVDFVAQYKRTKRTRVDNKGRLADMLRVRTGVRLPPNALFDVQIKRIHEYKRQLLNILEAIALYQAIRARPAGPWVGAAREDSRGQGGGRLRARQADHQAGERRGQGHQC